MTERWARDGDPLPEALAFVPILHAFAIAGLGLLLRYRASVAAIGMIAALAWVAAAVCVTLVVRAPHRAMLLGLAVSAGCAAAIALTPWAMIPAAVAWFATDRNAWPRDLTAWQRASVMASRHAILARAAVPTELVIEDAEVTPEGIELTVHGPEIHTAGVLDKAAGRFGAIFRAPSNRPVRVKAGQDQSRARLAIPLRDPIAGKLGPWPTLTPGVVHAACGVPLGQTVSGKLWTAPLVERSYLIAGLPRHGKSTLLQLVVAYGALCPDVQLWLIDAKAGMELSRWAPVAHRLATTPEEASLLLVELADDLRLNAAELARHGAQKHTPSASNPIRLLVVDELAEITRDRTSANRLRSLVSLYRAAGLSAWVATQRPSAELITGDLRALFQATISFGQRTKTDSDVVLGPGLAKEGLDAAKLRGKVGRCYVAEEHGTEHEARTFHLTHRDLTAVLQRARTTRTAMEAVYAGHSAPQTAEIGTDSAVPSALSASDSAVPSALSAPDPALRRDVFGAAPDLSQPLTAVPSGLVDLALAAWALLREHPEGLNVAAVAQALGVHRDTARKHLQGLGAVGWARTDDRRWYPTNPPKEHTA